MRYRNSIYNDCDCRRNKLLYSKMEYVVRTYNTSNLLVLAATVFFCVRSGTRHCRKHTNKIRLTGFPMVWKGLMNVPRKYHVKTRTTGIQSGQMACVPWRPLFVISLTKPNYLLESYLSKNKRKQKKSCTTNERNFFLSHKPDEINYCRCGRLMCRCTLYWPAARQRSPFMKQQYNDCRTLKLSRHSRMCKLIFRVTVTFGYECLNSTCANTHNNRS